MPGETLAGTGDIGAGPSECPRDAVRAKIGRLQERYGLGDDAGRALLRLLEALGKEPSPPTKVREPAEAVDVHVADSLSGLALEAVREATAIADIGSGAGFPGLVLAVALPGARVDLVEASGRKCAVMDRLSAAAGLTNARSIAQRAEEWAAGAGREAYELVTARAVASLAVLVEYGAPLLERGGSLVAWKGARDEAEERAGDAAAKRVGLSPGETVAVVPFEGARDRHLRVHVKVGDTPGRLPRRPGMAVKRPLG